MVYVEAYEKIRIYSKTLFHFNKIGPNFKSNVRTLQSFQKKVQSGDIRKVRHYYANASHSEDQQQLIGKLKTESAHLVAENDILKQRLLDVEKQLQENLSLTERLQKEKTKLMERSWNPSTNKREKPETATPKMKNLGECLIKLRIQSQEISVCTEEGRRRTRSGSKSRSNEDFKLREYSKERPPLKNIRFLDLIR